MVVLLRCKASPLEEDQLCETADPLWGLSPVHIFYHGIWHGQSHYSEKSRWPKTRPGKKNKRIHHKIQLEMLHFKRCVTYLKSNHQKIKHHFYVPCKFINSWRSFFFISCALIIFHYKHTLSPLFSS